MQEILSSEAIQLLAIETGFSQRTSKLPPDVFFDLMFYASSKSHNCSLEHLVSYLEDQYCIEMRKQSLDERFTQKTVNFCKAILKQLLKFQFSDILYSESFLSQYCHVRIKDSTMFKVPSNLSAHYKGCGSLKAGISIQYEFDLKSGKFLDLTINEFTRNDHQDAGETVENICEKDLVLRDMGYFSVSVLEKINDKKHFSYPGFLPILEFTMRMERKLINIMAFN